MNYLKIGISCFVCILLFFKYGYCQTTDRNKEVAKHYFEEVVNQQKLELLETVFADSFRTHILLDNTEQKKYNCQSV